MKVMQINCVYKKGSTGKIVNDIHKELLAGDIESVVCYGRGKKINEPFVYKTSSEFEAKFNNLKSRFFGLQYGGCFFSTCRLIGVIKKEKPDVVHLQCINGFFVNIYKLLEFLKINNIPTVLTLHAEFMYTGSCGHACECEKWKTGCGNCGSLRQASNAYFFDRTHRAWTKMRSAFNGFKNIEIVSVSPWLKSRAMQSPIMKNLQHTVVLNGVECDLFKPYDTALLRKEMKLENKYVILHVTSNFTGSVKGGRFVIELAERLKDRAVILLAGSKDTIPGLPDNIINLGLVKNQELLAKYYSMADLYVMTSKKETFSMPVAESLCCGTPVVGFMAGGPETISIPEYSEFTEYGNMDKLEKIVYKWIDKDINSHEIAEQAKKKFSKSEMAKQYIKIYRALTGTEGRK